MKQLIRILIFLAASTAYLPLFSQEIQSQDRPHSIQSDTLLQTLEHALFPSDATLIRIRDYPDCWRYEMKIDTNCMVRQPQPNHRKVGALLRQIAFTRDYRYFEPVMTMYQRHQEFFKQEWEEVHKDPNNTNCDAPKNQITIIMSFENALRALEFAHRKITPEEIWGYYKLKRDLDFNVWKKIGSYKENLQAYLFYSEYIRELFWRKGGLLTYETFVHPYSPFIDMLEPFIVQEFLHFEPANFIDYYHDTSKNRVVWKFTNYVRTMAEIPSVTFENILTNHFESCMIADGCVALFMIYAKQNKYISEEYVHFMLNQIFYNKRFTEMNIRFKERYLVYILDLHTHSIIKTYLMNKAQSTLPSVRALSYELLAQFPEDDVLELYLSRAQSWYISEEELEVIYHSLNYITYNKVWNDGQREKIHTQIKRMSPNYEKKEK